MINGLGVVKTAKLYLRVQHMLTSGADYADLAAVLPQACSDVLATAGFTPTDCATVKKAVTATEMAKQPTGPAAAAAVPEAGYCPTGRRDTILYDGFENFSTARWTRGRQWGLIGDYAKTGTYSVYGREPDYATSSSLTLNTAYPIPRTVKTYLRFAHLYRLDAALSAAGPYYDGARLEYQTGNSAWTSASGLPWQHPPNKRITPLGGRAYTAFGGDSRGYTSSRVDLSPLAGKTIKLRWRIFGDRQVAVDGWTIDDVHLFACGGTRPANLSALTVTPGPKKITVSWKQPLYTGAGITGYRLDRTGAAPITVSARSRSHTYTGLTPAKTYTITVTPRTKDGPGPTSTRTARAK